jgi:hypothetical protein
MGGLILRSILWGILGAIVVPVLGGILLFTATRADPRCGTPGDSGGCEMGVAAAAIMMIPAGAIGFALVSFLRGYRRLSRN